MSKYTIDRFEGEFAVLLDRTDESNQSLVLKSQLPGGVLEGDILQVAWKDNTNEIKNVEVLHVETQKEKRNVEDLLQNLLDKNK